MNCKKTRDDINSYWDQFVTKILDKKPLKEYIAEIRKEKAEIK